MDTKLERNGFDSKLEDIARCRAKVKATGITIEIYTLRVLRFANLKHILCDDTILVGARSIFAIRHFESSIFHLFAASSKLDSTRTDTSVDKAVAATDVGATLASSGANVVVTLEEHVIELNHLRQNISLLKWGHVLGSELDIEQITISEKFSSSLSQTRWLELGDGRKVSKVGSVELGRIVSHIRTDRSSAKDGFDAHGSQSSRAAWSPGGRKELCLGLGVSGISALHHLHDGLEATPTGRLDDFSKQLCGISISRSWVSGAISSVEGSSISAALTEGKASNAGLGAFSGEAAITTVALVGHERGSTGLVIPIDLLSWLEFGSIFVNVVELSMERVGGLAAAAGHGIGFFFDDLKRNEGKR